MYHVERVLIVVDETYRWRKVRSALVREEYLSRFRRVSWPVSACASHRAARERASQCFNDKASDV
jgi:hypothetical protein